MNKCYLLTFAALMFCSIANADSSKTITVWKITTHNQLGEMDYSPNREGGKINSTGIIKPCVQEPINIFKTKDGEYVEKIRITCEVGISRYGQYVICDNEFPGKDFLLNDADNGSSVTILPPDLEYKINVEG